MAAREYRYRLLSGYCRKNGMRRLLVAHTQDEQAETFFLNLSRGSGVFGLSGMAETSMRGGIAILRPLLSFSKAELRGYLGDRRQEWVEDPSNLDVRYKRVRIRMQAKLLRELELAPERLAKTMEGMRRAAEAIRFYADGLLSAAVVEKGSGRVLLDAGLFRESPEEVAIRALAELVCRLSGSQYPPRFESLSALFGKIASGGLGRGATLGGLKFSEAGSGRILVEPEPGRGAAKSG
jgi:tRNA(Ile)-lysidine synthase